MIDPVLLPVGLVLGAGFAGALISGVAQSGGVQTQCESRWSRSLTKFNPVTNLGNLFSLRSTARLVKSLAPAAIMVALGWGALKTLICRCR